jgi:pimeloyl-ACP methyl ester carboxylesterase
MLPALTQAGHGSTAVVLLHGIGGGRQVWSEAGSDTVRTLAQAGYRALAMDFPGYGDSVALGLPEMDRMVEAVLALITHLRAGRAGALPVEAVVLLGHSMGGMVAQEVVARHPQVVQGLVLACTSALFGKADGAWQRQFVADRLAPLDAGLGMAGMAQKLVPALMAASATAAAAALAQQTMAAVPEASYRVALAAIAGFDRRARLAEIAVPCLMLAAAEDRTSPPDMMQRMAGRVNGASYVCMQHTGHVANLDSPAQFNAAVLDFLHRHFAPPDGVTQE